MLMVRPSLPLVPSLSDRCGWVDQSGGGGDLWSVRCIRCGCINYQIRARRSHHVNGSGGRVDVCHGSPWRIPHPGVVVAAVAAMAVAGGGGLLGEDGECWEVAVSKGALHMSANPNQ